MPFFYLSFADPSLPKGQQFLGATIIEAVDFKMAIRDSWRLERNPGGEIMGAKLPFSKLSDIPPDAQKYTMRFVPREEVMAEPHRNMNELPFEEAPEYQA